MCFLCKAGGDLIECDHVHRGSLKRKQCRKVYHNYCLPFAVNESSKHWNCPRHFCDVCGTKNLKYMCKYCPMSICGTCPMAAINKVTFSTTCRQLSLCIPRVFLLILPSNLLSWYLCIYICIYSRSRPSPIQLILQLFEKQEKPATM